ncbi:MAG: hypothetical protein HY288_18710 [Planctomycetia bacterium]|nr:hypothetical protein [Planctomycetia bacterium]
MTKMLPKTGLCCVLLGLLALSAAAQEKAATTGAEAQFQRGFYLQVHQRDLSGAAVEFEKVVADQAASDALRSEAKNRLDQVREDLASANFARLMPADVLAYVEVNEPGEHIARILKMVGLLNPPAAAGPAEKPISLGNGLYLPADFSISPALVAELKKFRGAAAGLTALDGRNRPAGLVAINPGDCDLIRGALETAVQLLEPGEPIEGYKTYRIPEVGWVALTTRLIFVSDSREQLVSAVDRLRNPQVESLASRGEFKRAQSEAHGALLFAFVDGPQIVKRFGPQLRGQGAAIARTLLDLDHFESLVVALGTTDDGIRLQAQMNMAPGHHNMLYSLIRTAPITRRSLAEVPQGSAAVILIGLNPPDAQAPLGQADQNPPSISAMDIGREFFHNIEELAVFVLPPADSADSARPIPDVGAVIAVKDPSKSEALWNQLLSLAAVFGARTSQPVADVTIESKAGHIYHFAGAPPIAVVRSQDRTLTIGTEGAVAASVRAVNSNTSIVRDVAFGSLLGRITPDTSKAVLVDVGRSVAVAGALAKGREARELAIIGDATRDLRVSLVTDEAPNQLTIRVEATGLPKMPAILSLINQGRIERKSAATK